MYRSAARSTNLRFIRKISLPLRELSLLSARPPTMWSNASVSAASSSVTSTLAVAFGAASLEFVKGGKRALLALGSTAAASAITFFLRVRFGATLWLSAALLAANGCCAFSEWRTGGEKSSSLVSASRSRRGGSAFTFIAKVARLLEAFENLLELVVQALDFVRREAEMLAPLLGNPLLEGQIEALRFVFVDDAEELSYGRASVAVDERHSDSRALCAFGVLPELDRLNRLHLQRTCVEVIHLEYQRT